MGEGGVSFSISSEKSFLTIINKMFEAIDDVGIYGMEGGLNNESGKLEISADENDEVRVVGWIALIQKAFCENNLEPFSLKVNGVIDNDFYAYTAFEILCDQDSFKFREIEFTSEPSEDDGEYDLSSNIGFDRSFELSLRYASSSRPCWCYRGGSWR